VAEAVLSAFDRGEGSHESAGSPKTESSVRIRRWPFARVWQQYLAYLDSSPPERRWTRGTSTLCPVVRI